MNDRFRGTEKNANTYMSSKDILFVWAGIHAKKKTDGELYSVAHEQLDWCYLQLHAITENDSKPRAPQGG